MGGEARVSQVRYPDGSPPGGALLAHGIAAGANAGKVAAYGGTPLAINYAQWLRFAHAYFAWLKTRWRSPSEILQGNANANLQLLCDGWPDPGASDDGFPVLDAG